MEQITRKLPGTPLSVAQAAIFIILNETPGMRV